MPYNAGEFDIAVIGAGHAGCEAALATARLGLKTVIFAINLDSIANMPCNPRVGGTSKSQLVREIDALGGEMAKNSDKSYTLSMTLNESKGAAVYSQRVQIDRRRYQIEMKKTLENQDNLYIRQAEITDLIFENDKKDKIAGVMTTTGAIFKIKAAILATGTYLNGRIIIGDVSYSGGPDGLFPSSALSDVLRRAGVGLLRFKTGTPSRIDKKSIDFKQMIEQRGDSRYHPLSYENEYNKNYIPPQTETRSCYLTYTEQETHNIIRENLHRSPLYSGFIEGTGARYCPSIEDKIVRFPGRERHQVFVEPMGLETGEMYLQGMSSSLPEDVQIEMVHSLKGLGNAFIMRPGYAIEYDCLKPGQLKLSLELKKIKGLFSAGQINGTSGYEEAAAQGLIAGINAAMYIKGKEALVLGRDEAYIGVLVDDIVTKEINEPYRMMTSRAEYRLLLRQDNADLRLMPVGYNIGLLPKSIYNAYILKKERIEKESDRLMQTIIPPSPELSAMLKEAGSSDISTGIRLYDLLKRPEIKYSMLNSINAGNPDLDIYEAKEVEISIKYEGYIKREMDKVNQMRKLEVKKIPTDIDYEDIKGLRIEAIQKLMAIRPESIGQAGRIAGVNPADITLLLVYMEQKKKMKKQ